MRNRAKCKLCESIIESFHRYDWVNCKCGEISICGGTEKLECSSKNWNNFLRIDDQGNEIVVKVLGKDDEPESPSQQLSKNEKIEMLHQMAKNVENLPAHAMTAPISHYDYYALIALIYSIFQEEK